MIDYDCRVEFKAFARDEFRRFSGREVYEIIENLLDKEVDLNNLMRSKIVLDKIYLHNRNTQKQIEKGFYKNCWQLLWTLLWGNSWDKNTQPLNDIADYAGEQYAFYISWLMHYTSWLMVPSLGAVILLAIQVNNYRLGKCEKFENCFTTVGNSIFSIVIALWTTLMSESWKRKENLLADKWLVRDY